MPSPFPGMDPWLENPRVWPDVHNSLAGEVRRLLNDTLPAGYYAQLEERTEVVAFDGDFDGDDVRRAAPDVGIGPSTDGGGGTAVLTGMRTAVTPFQEILADELPTLLDVGVYSLIGELVTLVEILSPANKRQNRRELLEKRLDLLRSDAGLVEIDLLRRGRRVCGDSEGGPPVRVPIGTAYLVLVSRPWERGASPYPSGGFRWHAAFLQLADRLPVVPVPLRERESDVPVDLQYCFERAYDSGPFRRQASRYDSPPDPPLPPAAAEWAAARVAAWRAAA